MTSPQARQSPDLARAANRSLPMLLLRLRERVLLPLRPVIRKFDLSEQQARVLIVLSEAGALEVLALAGECCLHPPSLSRLIPKLRVRGWVECCRSDADGRRLLVTLTPEGRAFTAGLRDALRQEHDDTSHQLGGSRLHALVSELEAAIATLGSPVLTGAPADGDEGL